MNEVEYWKDIDGYDGVYQVSNLGRVRKLDFDYNTITIISQRRHTNGYLQVNLNKCGKIKTVLVHRLVAEAFIPNPNNYPIVNHKDEDKTNPRADNLEWCTCGYNLSYGSAHKKRRDIMLGNTINNNRVWINLAGKTKHVKKEMLQSYLNDGWNLGRV